MTDLKPDWVVVGNDDRRVGSIRELSQNYMLVSTAGPSRYLYVPASAIANVENEVVHLNVSAVDAEAMGWAQQPRDDDVPASPAGELHRHV